MNEKSGRQSSAELREVHPTSIVISKGLSLRCKNVKKAINLVKGTINGESKPKSAIFKGSPRAKSKSPSAVNATSHKNSSTVGASKRYGFGQSLEQKNHRNDQMTNSKEEPSQSTKAFESQ